MAKIRFKSLLWKVFQHWIISQELIQKATKSWEDFFQNTLPEIFVDKKTKSSN